MEEDIEKKEKVESRKNGVKKEVEKEKEEEDEEGNRSEWRRRERRKKRLTLRKREKYWEGEQEREKLDGESKDRTKWNNRETDGSQKDESFEILTI